MTRPAGTGGATATVTRPGWRLLLRLLPGLLLVATVPAPSPVDAQIRGREAATRLDAPPLRFRAPEVEEKTLSNGVTVFFLEDRALPMVNVYATFRAGYGRFPREYYAAGTALPAILRGGGGGGLSPDSVDQVLEHYAIQHTFGGSGEGVSTSMNTLTRHLDRAMEIWGALLREPAFDTAAIAVWRGQELDNVRRRQDNPARLAFSEFNRLMYGDHPVGWDMTEEDLAPDRLTVERFRWLQARILCPERLTLGVAGDVTWDRMEPLLEGWVADWPACAEPLPPAPTADVGVEPGVYLIDRPFLQATVVVAQPTGLRQGSTPEYFASRVGNVILGGGGFTSRLVKRIRTEEGLAYGASSLWTAPRNYDGLLGATTRTGSEGVVPAVEIIRSVLADMAREAPDPAEVATTVREAVNGFVFNFQSPAQVVTRRMSYRSGGLPDDWLERYLEGIQEVDPEGVRRVFAEHLDPSRTVILVVGDAETLLPGLETLGPVRRYPSEWPRCRTSGADTPCR